MSYYLLFWPALCIALAGGQGWLLPAIRRTPPGTTEANQQAMALHWLPSAAYFLPLFLCPASVALWQWGLLAFAVRVALFDPVLNYFAGKPLFYVGFTAQSDKLLRTLAGSRATILSAVLRVVAVLGVAAVLVCHG